jgi:CheY-like chemotaxis protein
MGHRILVIEDAADVAVTLQMLLRRAGHEVVMAENGRRGLRRFFETRPDLVLLDLVMPEMNGWETLERLRDLSDVPVLVFSGTEPTPEELERLRPGKDAFRPKPLFGDALLGTVGELLAAHEPVAA